MSTIGVFATIFDNNQHVLCVRQNYSPFFWTTPGGRLEVHESPADGAVREVLEETGYQVVIHELVGVYSAPFKDDIILSFEASIVGRDPTWKPTEEIAEAAFFDPKALPSPMKVNTAMRILDAYHRRRGIFRVFTSADHGAIYDNDVRLAG
jgi:8-oxo-dGTP diphosphatase